MRGGDDQVVMAGMLVPVDGGPGTDWVRAVGFADERSMTPEQRVAVNLTRDTLVINNSRPATPITNIENAEVDGFGTAVLRGDAQGNELVVGQTCLARLYGLGGPDTLGGSGPGQCDADLAEFFGVPLSIVAHGAGGNDLDDRPSEPRPPPRRSWCRHRPTAAMAWTPVRRKPRSSASDDPNPETHVASP